MKTKVGIIGAVLLLSTVTAYGLDMSSAPADAVPTPPVSASHPGNAAPAMAVDAKLVRERLTALGVDPDSETGQVFARWFLKIASDPALMAAMNDPALRGTGFLAKSYSPSDRLRVLSLLKAMSSGGPDGCTRWARRMDLVAMAKTAPPPAIDAVFELMELAAKHAAASPQQPPYAVVDLLDADAHLNAIPDHPPSGTHAYPPGQCGELLYGIDAITAFPEPTRERASFELFQTMSGKKTAAQRVADDPLAYLDDTFDERQLPEALRSALPPDGSRPLPFTRFTVDARWVNKTTPADDASFKDMYINRRNNGVIAEVATATGWSDFILSYGVGLLRTQTVGAGKALTALGTLENASSIAVAGREPAPNAAFDTVVPQPSNGGVKSRHCEVGESMPASTVFPSLKGIAVPLVCTQVKKNGTKVGTHGVWLRDYGIGWTESIDDEDGRTEAVIQNITIEGAPQ